MQVTMQVTMQVRRNKMYKLSYSSISNYLQCPRKFKEVNVDYRFKDSGVAAQKGTDIHKAIEDYIKGISVTYPLEDYQHTFIEAMRAMYKKKLPEGCTIGIEQSFAVDDQFNPCDYKDPKAILRGKIDLYVLTPNMLKVIDWKTGKRRDNKLQATVYDCLTNHLLPNGTRTFTFDYLKNGRDPEIVITEKDKYNLVNIIDTIQTAEEFPERPGPLCAWCPVPKAFCKLKKE